MTTTTLNLKFKGTDYQVPFSTNSLNCPIEEFQEFIQTDLDHFPSSMLSMGIYPANITYLEHGYDCTWILTFALRDSIESFNLGPILRDKLTRSYSDPEVYSGPAQIITTDNTLTIIAIGSM